MSHRAIPRLVVLAVAVAAFVAQGQEKKTPTTLEAQRYKIIWADSAMSLVHGRGHWVEEIYIPDRKVACTLVYQPGKDLKNAPRVYAHFADRARNDLTGLNKKIKTTPIEKITIPVEVADAIAKLAELQRRHEAETWRLGGVVASHGLLREVPAKR